MGDAERLLEGDEDFFRFLEFFSLSGKGCKRVGKIVFEKCRKRIGETHGTPVIFTTNSEGMMTLKIQKKRENASSCHTCDSLYHKSVRW
jgi:hypothetical protein